LKIFDENIVNIFRFQKSLMTNDIHDLMTAISWHTKKMLQSKKVAQTFENRNGHVVALQCKMKRTTV